MAKQSIIQVLINAKDNASRTLRNVGGRMEKMGRSAQRAAPGLIAIGAAGATGLGFAVKAAIDFESSFAGVRKTVNASEEEFAALAQNFRNIAKETPIATDQLNRIGELAGQLGVSGVDNITKFTKTIADITVTTNLMEEEAALNFARIANIMQEPIKNVDRMGASVVDLGNNFAVMEGEITNFAERISGAGRVAGLTTADVLGISAAFGSVGVQAERGGTAVSKTLFRMTDAVGNSTEELKDFADIAGLTAQEFADLFEKDAGAAFNKFVEGLGKGGIKATKFLEDLELGDQRLQQAFISVAGAGGTMEKAISKSGEAWQENTALIEEAEKRYETTAAQLKILLNNVVEVARQLGEFLLPTIKDLVNAAKPVLETIANWIKQNPKLAASILIAAIALGALGLAIVVLGPIIGALMSGFGLVAVAVAVLAVAWANNFLGIRDITMGLIDFVLNTAIPKIKGFIDGVIGFINNLKNNWKKILGEDLPHLLGKALGIIVRKILEFGIKSFVLFHTWPQKVGKAIWDNRHKIFEFFRKIFDAVFNFIKDNIKKQVEEFKKLPGKIADSFKQQFKSAKSFASGFVQGFTGKQFGGPVQADRPFIVGEKGPELFVPRQSGEVIPNDKLGRASVGDNITINLHIGTLIDSDHTRRNFAERLMDDIENIASMKGKKARILT